ncbi:four-carbon acid sugar kinase family protein [Rhizobium sp. C104]|uniref:four-carbon acid sugar kinase family protein n=1 Tax=Rhizobium sp. C104 TaxID=2917727 RepID=UPI0023BAC266|nr:four-carbon acid sugar kinase family protein [Rhizobium sp. C104]
MTSAGKLKAVFYGDDFTGSSENLAQFHRSGVKGKLYLARPSAQTASTDALSYDVLGFAGTARALSGVELDEELDSAFSIMRTLNSPLIQYKICSTFELVAHRWKLWCCSGARCGSLRQEGRSSPRRDPGLRALHLFRKSFRALCRQD